LCGRLVVMSSFTREVWKRSVGVIGLYVLIGIFFARNFYSGCGFKPEDMSLSGESRTCFYYS
jgi:hypothetical protein